MSRTELNLGERPAKAIAPAMRNRPVSGAWVIALTYGFVGILWIIVSDRVVLWWGGELSTVVSAQLLKGLLYVFITASIVFFLSRYVLLKLDSYYQELLVRQKAIEVLEERYRLALDAVGDGVYDWNIATGSMRVTDAWLATLGYTREEIAPTIQFWQDRIHPADIKMANEERQRHFDGKSPQFECEYRVRNKQSEYRWTLERGKVIERDGSGIAIRMVGTNRDITEMRNAIDRMSDLEDRLLHVSRLCTMGELVAGIAHEINQPLHTISNYAEASSNVLLRGEDIDVQELSQWNQEIRSAVHRTGQVIRRLKDFLTHSVQKMQAVSLNDVIHEGLKLLKFELRRRHTEVHLHLEDDIPPLVADHIMLQQVLVNLVKNSLDAMRDMEDRPSRIVISNHRTGRGVELRISDNGPGLAPEILNRLFQPFATTKEEGMGVGLAICKTIVELHHGTITGQNCSPSLTNPHPDAEEIESQQHGAIFRIYLPFDDEQMELHSLLETAAGA
ncbi:MAG: PAS domain-containing protein [Pirellulales bacterium]